MELDGLDYDELLNAEIFFLRAKWQTLSWISQHNMV
jgi:hypothetical protein